MPRFTEHRIKELCKEAVAVRTTKDVDEVLVQLRAALEEHINLARFSLHAQASALPLLESLRKKKGAIQLLKISYKS